MTTEQAWLVAAGVVALAAVVLAVLTGRRARRAEAAVNSLASRVALLESPVTDVPTASLGAEPTTYVITHLDEPEEALTGQHREQLPEALPVARPIDGRLFADIVARETVVKAASWTHGLRRALAPETRNRIRFEVRRETRRATRDRRAETRQALREFRARERRAVSGEVGEDVA